MTDISKIMGSLNARIYSSIFMFASFVRSNASTETNLFLKILVVDHMKRLHFIIPILYLLRHIYQKNKPVTVSSNIFTFMQMM